MLSFTVFSAEGGISGNIKDALLQKRLYISLI
jgi:hypothetical protein